MALNLIPFIYSLAGVLRQMSSVAIIIIIEKCSAIIRKCLSLEFFHNLITKFYCIDKKSVSPSPDIIVGLPYKENFNYMQYAT